MSFFLALVLFSSLSFLTYGIAYFKSPNMKSEFKRFGLEKQGMLVAILEVLGAIGLLVGLAFNPIMVLSAGGLALLMLLGVAVRLKIGDSVLVCLPAFSFMVLNAYVFYKALPQ